MHLNNGSVGMRTRTQNTGFNYEEVYPTCYTSLVEAMLIDNNYGEHLYYELFMTLSLSVTNRVCLRTRLMQWLSWQYMIYFVTPSV